MSYKTDNLNLCEVCENFRDFDKVISNKGFKHHRSYAALCKAADNGCDLCKLFISSWHSVESEEVPSNFEEYMDAGEAQIMWSQHSQGCIFMLRQDPRALGNLWFNLWVEVYTEDDDPLSALLSGRPIQTTSNSQECFDLVSDWMEKCRKEHPFCPRDEERPLPTRVIDVGSESRDPFLYNGKGKKGQWATLSHCWGKHMPTKTTKDTVAKRELSIPLDELQQTFQDAILITRTLGLRYLWIDCLCIIQDSHEDWGRESTQMHDIYSRASINISATAAHSSQDGIFNSADKDRYHTKPFVVFPSYSNNLKVEGTLSIRIKTTSWPMLNVTDQPLHRRAWVLQESTLSPRRIDFASEQLHWSCRSSTLQEGDPRVPNSQDWYVNRKELFQMPLGDIPPQPDEKRLDKSPMSWWYQTLSLYCDRSLTFSEDSLPAISGIARQVKERTGYNYKAGLWLEDFHRALLWQPDHGAEPLKNTSVPSWSWASTKMPWIMRRLGLDIYLPNFRATIHEVSVHTLEDNHFAPVISASLKIDGGCKLLESWHIGTSIIYNKWPSSMTLCNKWISPQHRGLPWDTVPPPGHIVCTLDKSPHENLREPDYEIETHSRLIERKVICLQIAKFGHNRLWHFIETDDEIATVFALVLEPTGCGGDEYKRIGIAEIPEDNGMAEGWERRLVTVV